MERPWRGSAPRTATRPAIYRTGFYRLMTGLVGWPCMRTQEVWVQGAGLGADDDRRAPCGSRDDFANGILFLLLSQDPPSPPATISPSSISSLFCGIWLALSLPPSSTLPSPGPSLPAPGHSVPPPQALTSVSCGSFWLGSHRRLWWGSSTCMLCELGQVSTPPT